MDGQLIVYIVVGVFQVAGVIGGVFVAVYRFGQGAKTTDLSITNMAATIAEIKAEVVAMRALMTDVALQKQEIGSLRDDIAQLRAWYDELRHGEGMVFPFGSRLNQKSGA